MASKPSQASVRPTFAQSRLAAWRSGRSALAVRRSSTLRLVLADPDGPDGAHRRLHRTGFLGRSSGSRFRADRLSCDPPFGPAAGTITAAVDALVMSLRLPPHLRTPHRIFFNVGALAITVFPSALLYFRLAGLDTRAPDIRALDTFVGPLYLFAVSVFVFNSWLVALALRVERTLSAARNLAEPVPVVCSQLSRQRLNRRDPRRVHAHD